MVGLCMLVSEQLQLIAPAQELRLILGDQLDEQHSWFERVEPQVVYVLLETRSETDYARHHIQKVVAYFLAMRGFAARLSQLGHRVHYMTLDTAANTQDIVSELRRLGSSFGVSRISYQLPDEWRLDQALATALEQDNALPNRPEWRAVDSEHFLGERDALFKFNQGKRRYIMEYFYRDMRRRYGILLDSNGQPEGGAWNFDKDNRHAAPRSLEVADPRKFAHDPTPIVELLAEQGVVTMGSLNPSGWEWPLTRAEGLAALEDFVQQRLPRFGTYQDAMLEDDPYLFHARISFAMNSKLIRPMEVVEAAIAAYRQRPEEITINQIEGFVRQIVGWREYMRGIYWAEMPAFAKTNALQHTLSLPSWYWDGKTDMNCLAHAVGQSLERAYAHHIQRLMITGNFALLLGCHPDEVDAWYLGVYIDAIEWVEITNTRGMSQFADGGLVGTKPYISSANYINKMSDYCRGCHYDPKLRHGPRACPFNSLYWAFIDRHSDRIGANPRSSQMLKLWQRFGPDEQEATLLQAAYYQAHRDQL